MSYRHLILGRSIVAHQPADTRRGDARAETSYRTADQERFDEMVRIVRRNRVVQPIAATTGGAAFPRQG